jgi:hypothetical protein
MRGDGPLIGVSHAGLRPADRRRASGTRAPGDGGRTARSCEEPYDGATFQGTVRGGTDFSDPWSACGLGKEQPSVGARPGSRGARGADAA